jgi:hypothetical protein
MPSPIYGLTLWALAQDDPHIPHNEALLVLEALERGSVSDRDLVDAPATSADGEAFLIDSGTTPGDDWEGHEGEMAISVGVNASNGWLFATVAKEGTVLWVEDEATRIQCIGAGWSTFPDVTSLFQTAVTASEAIDAGDLVCVFDSAGNARVQLADGGDPAKPCHAFALAAAAMDDPCTIMSTGINKQVSPAATGPVWLSEATPGGYTFTAPSATGEIVQPVGTAIEGVGILFNPGAAIELG